MLNYFSKKIFKVKHEELKLHGKQKSFEVKKLKPVIYTSKNIICENKI